MLNTALRVTLLLFLFIFSEQNILAILPRPSKNLGTKFSLKFRDVNHYLRC